MIAFYVKITIIVSKKEYDIMGSKVKVKFTKNLSSACYANFSFIWTEGVHIWHNDRPCCVDCTAKQEPTKTYKLREQ